MPILTRPTVAIFLGALLVSVMAAAVGSATGPRMAAELEAAAERALAAAQADPVQASFVSPSGWPTRHPLLSGGEQLDEATRARAARAVAAVPAVGGLRWADSGAFVARSHGPQRPVDCQADVEALLRTRSIRFEESSARIDTASSGLVDEVAAALRPCLGNIIAITGHTDASGPEAGNISLSLVRADAVRQALIRRGIPADGLRASGVGSKVPVEGLEPADPANRRIEFSVVATEPIKPTPVDTPGPR